MQRLRTDFNYKHEFEILDLVLHFLFSCSLRSFVLRTPFSLFCVSRCRDLYRQFFEGGFLIKCVWLGNRGIRFVGFFLSFDMITILTSHWKVALKLLVILLVFRSRCKFRFSSILIGGFRNGERIVNYRFLFISLLQLGKTMYVLYLDLIIRES